MGVLQWSERVSSSSEARVGNYKGVELEWFQSGIWQFEFLVCCGTLSRAGLIALCCLSHLCYQPSRTTVLNPPIWINSHHFVYKILLSATILRWATIPNPPIWSNGNHFACKFTVKPTVGSRSRLRKPKCLKRQFTG